MGDIDLVEEVELLRKEFEFKLNNLNLELEEFNFINSCEREIDLLDFTIIGKNNEYFVFNDFNFKYLNKTDIVNKIEWFLNDFLEAYNESIR